MIPRMHKIYIILAGDEAMKIGLALDPEKRLEQLQIGNHRDLRLVAAFYAGSLMQSQKKEKDIHNILHKYHIRGEWFKPNLAKAVKVLIELCGERVV